MFTFCYSISQTHESEKVIVLEQLCSRDGTKIQTHKALFSFTACVLPFK